MHGNVNIDWIDLISDAIVSTMLIHGTVLVIHKEYLCPQNILIKFHYAQNLVSFHDSASFYLADRLQFLSGCPVPIS